MKSLTCTRCGCSFVVRSASARRRYCSQECGRYARQRLPWITCPTCAQEFPPRMAVQRFCSVSCAQIARYRKGAA